MELFQEDFIEEAFCEALSALKEEIASEDRDPIGRMMAYTGRKSSTIYFWLAGHLPVDPRDLWRLSVGSTRDGFISFARALHAPTFRLLPWERGVANGTLADELQRSTLTWGRLLQAEADGNADAMIRLADDLRRISDDVHEEAARMLSR